MLFRSRANGGDALDRAFQSGGRFGGGKRKVGKLEVDRLEVRERDFARFAAAPVRASRFGERSRRPLAGLGLAFASATGV